MMKTIWLLTAGAVFGQAPEKVNFERQVEPVLEAKCYGCHGAEKQMAGLRLDRRQAALRGGDYGKVIEPGNSGKSKLIQRVEGSTAGMRMPPAGPLEAEEIAILRAWIDQGPEYGNSQARRGRPAAVVPVALAGLIEAVVADDVEGVGAWLTRDRTVAGAADAGGATALMHAAGRGSLSAMAVLLRAGADVNARNRRGATALTWALGDAGKVRLLLENGAEVTGKTVEGRGVLHIAAQQPGQVEVLEMLLEKGADPNAADVAGMTPVHLAATAGSEALLTRLLAAGGNVNAVSGNGMTPLILAATSGAKGAVRLLLANGADATKVTKKNGSALAAAAYWGDVETMELLIAKGAPVQLADHEGYAPLTYAAYSEVAGVEAVRLLLRHGATAPVTAEGETPASLAAKRGAAEVAKLVSGAGAGVLDAATIRGAIARAFEPLRAQSPNFVKIGGCNSCHNQDLPAYAMSVARKRGVAVTGEITMAPGGQAAARTFEHSGLLGASSIGYEAMSRVARGQAADETTDAMVNYLMAHQEPDGRWASRSNRQPLTAGDAHATAFAIFVLKHYGRAGVAEAAVARGVAWMKESAPASNQDAAMRVMGLVWGGAARGTIAKAAEAVSERQLGDGGWAQLPAIAADAYATGQALYALALAGVPAEATAYQRGVAYLLRTQAPDGTWHVKARSKPLQPNFESGFPYGHDQWISAAGTSWAAMALSMAVGNGAPLYSSR